MINNLGIRLVITGNSIFDKQLDRRAVSVTVGPFALGGASDDTEVTVVEMLVEFAETLSA